MSPSIGDAKTERPMGGGDPGREVVTDTSAATVVHDPKTIASTAAGTKQQGSTEFPDVQRGSVKEAPLEGNTNTNHGYKKNGIPYT